MPELTDLLTNIDPIAALLAIVALVIALFFGVMQLRARVLKRLSYDVLSDTKLLQGSLPNDFQLHYRGQAVIDPRILLLRLYNGGNVPIDGDDYERPIHLEPGGSVLGAAVVGQQHPLIKASVNVGSKPGLVLVELGLLNREQWIDVEVLLADSRDTIKVYGQVRGVDKITRAVFGVPRLKSLPLFLLSAVVTFSLAYALGIFADEPDTLRRALAAAIAAGLGSQVGVYSAKRHNDAR